MPFFKNVFRRLRFWKRTSAEPVVSTEHDFTRTLKRYEYFVYKIQHILLWENPSETLLTIAVVNLLFWIFASLEWRFYGIIFTVLLITTLHEVWTKEIWPEIRVHEPQQTVDERLIDLSENDPNHQSLIRLSRALETSQKFINDYFCWLKNMREQKPGIFCCLMTSVFFSLSFIGRVIPGLVLVYLIVMTTLLAPGIWVHIVSDECKKSIITKWNALQYSICHTSDDLPSEEDYLPYTTNEELAVLSHFVEPDFVNEELNSRASSATQLSVPISFMPSHDDTSIDSLATFSDLDVIVDNAPKTIHDIDDFSDDSSGGDIGIDFQTGHFNGDESSSEEEEKVFTNDLKFTESDLTGNILSSSSSSSTMLTGVPSISSVVDKNATADNNQEANTSKNFLTSNLLGLSALGHNYIINVINRNIMNNNSNNNNNDTNKKMIKNDSSDSLGSEEDFEMISHEDIS